MAKLSISFKNTKKDMELYKFLFELEDRSTEIKEALRKFYDGKINKTDKQVENINKVTTDSMFNITEFFDEQQC